jgi:hypothetical protein
VAFPRAFASETILLASSNAVDTFFRLKTEELMASYDVPDFRFALNLGSHYLPGYFWDAVWIEARSFQPFTVSILDQADNLRRLVRCNDNSDVSSCAYPYPTLLDGVPC